MFLKRAPFDFARYGFALALALGVTGPSIASAQTTEISEGAMVARRALVERAQEAARAGNHEQALSLAENAGRIEMSPSLRLFIAQERVALGRHASAMEAAELCVREASRAPTLERRDQIIAACRQILNTSQRNVVLLTLTVPAARRGGFALRVDGRAISDAELALPVALDAGTHVVEVTANGADTHRETLRGAPGETLTFTVPSRFAPDPITNAGTATGAATGTGTATGTATGAGTGQATGTGAGTGAASATGHGTASHTNSSGTGNSSTNSNGNGRSTPTPTPTPPPPDGFFARVGAGPFVIGGIGVVGFALSGVFAVVAANELTRAGCRVAGNEILCRTPEQAAAFMSNAPGSPDPYTPTTIAQISAIGGAVLVTGAVVWMAVGATRSRSSTTTVVERSTARARTWLSPSFDPRSSAASVTIGGTF